MLRVLPYEIGKLFHLHILGLHGNPLGKDVMSIFNEPNGTQKLLTYMLDNLSGECLFRLLFSWFSPRRHQNTFDYTQAKSRSRRKQRKQNLIRQHTQLTLLWRFFARCFAASSTISAWRVCNLPISEEKKLEYRSVRARWETRKSI
jgi:hypothetical protein